MSASELVQRQLDAYNAQDLNGFCACFAEDAILADYNGDVTHEGIGAVRERYATLFAEYPQNHAKLLNRIVVGGVVIDEEEILRDPRGASFRAVAIYTVEHGRIVRVEFVR